jgi:hypothetical protein
VVVWQSDSLTSALQSVLVVPLTTNLERAPCLELPLSLRRLAGPAQEAGKRSHRHRIGKKAAQWQGARPANGLAKTVAAYAEHPAQLDNPQAACRSRTLPLIR